MTSIIGRARMLALPADTWERHAILAAALESPRTVLDVGGVAGELDLFLPDAEVTSLNVEGPADKHFDGSVIPFPDASFDAAVSLDVLEHIPHDQRLMHLTEMRRVARRQVVICCPLGSPEHVQAERDLADWYRETTGEPHRFLEEHLETGLPTEEEIRGLASAAGLEQNLGFHGDYRGINELFRLSTRAKSRPRPRSLGAYARARLGMRRTAETDAESGPFTNRVFLIASVAPAN